MHRQRRLAALARLHRGDRCDGSELAVVIIPLEHSARLIALGYMVDIAGRLRMTTPGRYRIYAGQIAT
jgi:hypothetical protein